jgi:hypothetical protein
MRVSYVSNRVGLNVVMVYTEWHRRGDSCFVFSFSKKWGIFAHYYLVVY